MRCADVTGIGSAIFDAWDRPGNPTRCPIPFGASDVMTRKQFDEHGVIGTSGEVLLNRRNVPAQPVSRKLETSINSFAEIAHESIGAHSFTLPDMKTENHFRDAIECNPHVLISPLRRRVHRQPALMAANKTPNFIRLYKLRANAANLRIPQLAAVPASGFKDAEDRGFVHSAKSGNGANAHSLKHERKHLGCGFRRSVMRSKFRSGRISKGCRARCAAPSLYLALAVEAESFAGSVFAFPAGHGFSPLAFCGEKPENQLWSRSWLTPRFGLAPTPAETEAGALSYTLSNYGGLIRTVGLLSMQPLSADTLRGSYLTPKSLADPFVDRLIALHPPLNHPSLPKANQDCMDRSQWAFVSAQIESALNHSVSNFRRRQG